MTPETKAAISDAVAQGRDGVYDRIPLGLLTEIEETELPNYWHTVAFLVRTIDRPLNFVVLTPEQQAAQRARLDEAWEKLKAYAA